MQTSSVGDVQLLFNFDQNFDIDLYTGRLMYAIPTLISKMFPIDRIWLNFIINGTFDNDSRPLEGETFLSIWTNEQSQTEIYSRYRSIR